MFLTIKNLIKREHAGIREVIIVQIMVISLRRSINGYDFFLRIKLARKPISLSDIIEHLHFNIPKVLSLLDALVSLSESIDNVLISIHLFLFSFEQIASQLKENSQRQQAIWPSLMLGTYSLDWEFVRQLSKS